MPVSQLYEKRGYFTTEHRRCTVENNVVLVYEIMEKSLRQQRERVMTNPKELVRIELKNAGFDIDSMQIPQRVYLLADDIYDAMLERRCGKYKYPLGGSLYVLKNNPEIGFIKSAMCSAGIATQVEDLVAGGVKEFIHVGLAGGIKPNLKVGDIMRHGNRLLIIVLKKRTVWKWKVSDFSRLPNIGNVLPQQFTLLQMSLQKKDGILDGKVKQSIK